MEHHTNGEEEQQDVSLGATTLRSSSALRSGVTSNFDCVSRSMRSAVGGSCAGGAIEARLRGSERPGGPERGAAMRARSLAGVQETRAAQAPAPVS